MNKKTTIALTILLGVLAVVIMKSLKTNNLENTKPPAAASNTPTHNIETASKSSTVSDRWQWTDSDSQNQSNPNQQQKKEEQEGEPLPFTPLSVHNALAEVKIDANGDLVLDNHALISLDEALERIYNRLNEESKLQLESLIQSALPGKVGKETSQLVSNYADFLKAKEQFSQMYENTAYSGPEQTIGTINRDQQLYSELQALREVYLGEDVTQRLFREHDATAMYMFESMKLSLDESVTPENKQQRQQEIEDRFREIVPIENPIEPEQQLDSGKSKGVQNS